ncbi:MAG: RNA polymerase sigma factor [Alphaproteobacteria bacterium]|nr:RNA polymerase sigma factor [Alphaproteobacteria bacterium]
MAAQLKLVAPEAAASWPDEDIKVLAGENPRLAMDMVIRKHRERLFRHAAYITKDQQEAYDIVQEVFIRAMREQRFWDLEFRQKAWLYRVTSNLCFNLVRDRRRRGQILETVPHKEHADADQLRMVFEGEQRAEVLAAIDQMTPDHKEILLLRYYDDLSYAEIAEVLDVALGTVMSRLSRARRRLLDVMDPGAEQA